MINDEVVKKLIQISKPKSFKAHDYICYEGQPGNEMYVILKGCVGVFLVSAINTVEEVARVNAGDFFGEMAIFDNMPRSASCIALEDTICIAIDKSNLKEFITSCPEMTEKLLRNMSMRIRNLNDEIYKSEKFAVNHSLPPFVLPEEYSFSHIVEEPSHNLRFTEPISAACPICGQTITVINTKLNIMSKRKIDRDRRIHYTECDPIWFHIWSCPYCHYSNFYRNFFKILPFNVNVVKNLLNEQHDPVIKQKTFLKTPFDQLFLKYMQAIHVNQLINSGDDLLIGNLWLNLHWLFDDASDPQMAKYCGENAAEHLIAAYKGLCESDRDENIRQSIAMTIADLLYEIGRKSEAAYYCDEVTKYSDSDIKKDAYLLKSQIG